MIEKSTNNVGCYWQIYATNKVRFEVLDFNMRSSRGSLTFYHYALYGERDPKKRYEKDLRQFKKLTKRSRIVKKGFSFTSTGKATAIYFKGSGSDRFRIKWTTVA